MSKPDDEIDHGAPPHMCAPDGALEVRRAWWNVVIDKADAGGASIEGTVDELFDRVKRRGRERLARAKRAA